MEWHCLDSKPFIFRDAKSRPAQNFLVHPSPATGQESKGAKKETFDKREESPSLQPPEQPSALSFAGSRGLSSYSRMDSVG